MSRLLGSIGILHHVTIDDLIVNILNPSYFNKRSLLEYCLLELLLKVCEFQYA